MVERSSRYPALWAAAGLACGVALATRLSPPWWTLVPGPVLVGVALARHGWARVWVRSACALVLMVLAGWWWHVPRKSHPAPRLSGAGVEGCFVGAVCGPIRATGTGTRFELRLRGWGPDSVATATIRGTVLVRVAPTDGFREGDVVAVRGRLRRPRGYSNPGLFDYRAYLSRRGISGTISGGAGAVRLVERPSMLSAAAVLGSIRSALRRVLERHRLTPSFSLLPGLLLGQRWEVDQSVREAFASAGVIHVLAISGLHVGFVAGILFPVLRALRLGRRGTVLGVAVGLGLYAALTGGRPSVVRAAVMACILIVGMVSQRSWSAPNSLGVAALLILAVSPGSVFDVGFQLSFLATASIILLSPPFLSRVRPRSWQGFVLGALCVSLAAQAGVAFVVARHFHEIHPAAPLANLVVIPLAGISVAIGFATLAAGSVSRWLADVFAHANLIPLELSVAAARLIGSLPGATVGIHPPGLAAGVAYYLGLGAVAVALRRRRRWLWWGAGSCLLVALGLWWGRPLWARGFEVVVLDVGEGDSIFVRAPGGGSLLVDGGLRTRYTDVGQQVVWPYLRSQAVGRLGCLMLTHPHNDHVGGLPAVVSSVDVERAVGTRYPHTSWSYRRYVDCLQDRQVEWKRVLEGDVIWVGEAMLHVLYPRESDLEAVRSKPQLGLNTVSIVARLCYGDFAMLLAGDAEELTERALLSRGLPLRADVLKVGHHGANTSSSAPFLRAVGADAAIISAGACNRFGHPHADALRRLRRAGCRIYRTDLHGAVTVTSDGRTYRIRTTRPVDLGAAGRQ